MNVSNSIRTSHDDSLSQKTSIEYRVIYSIIFTAAFAMACLCLLLPKRLNPMCGDHEQRSPMAQAKMSAGGVLPYVFRM